MSTPDVYYNNDKHSFGFSTARSRWPRILTTAISDTMLEYSKTSSTTLKICQGKEIEQLIKQLNDSLSSNSILELFSEECIQKIPGLKSYNETMASFKHPINWLDGPWLFCECYIYRVLDSFFKLRSEWIDFDIFERLKREAFRSSANGVYELAIGYKTLSQEIESTTENLDAEKLKLLFEEFIDVSLWGNATDLSLLANATLEDIQSRQGKEAREKSAKNILCNDLPFAWERLLSVPYEQRRIDFILDNAGFEFYTDLVLTLFLLDSKLAPKVVFHCKTRPWMVSDTMTKDYSLFLKDMADPLFFPQHSEELKYFVDSLEKYHKNGQFELTDSEFWTIDLDYWNISAEETKYGGSKLWKYFQDSTLVIVKGDLNYRKLTGDRKWPRSTPFITAIDRLANSNIPILALRTCKADVCAGLPEGVDEKLCEYWKSLGNEFGELWCSSGKWAVISYSSGKL